MGYCETLCQLCGVSFAIARHRRPDEPESAAWDYTGSRFIEQQEDFEVDERCGEATGCTLIDRGDGSRSTQDPEHVAGFHCVSDRGYSGWRISVEEMSGCRAVQALVKKESGWMPEPDDHDWEREGEYFLTGIGDGSPDESPLENMRTIRHGVDSLVISNCVYGDDDDGLPFHPTCFEIFKKMSERRLGRVDVEGLWYWRKLEPNYEDFFERGPHDYAARSGYEQWWLHEPGCEYLAANPIDVPGLAKLVEPYKWGSAKKTTFGWKYQQSEESYPSLHRIPPPKVDAGPDPFGNLSAEISDMILENLCSRDIANLRLASRMFRQLPNLLFRRLLSEDMPWMWEFEDSQMGKVDWHKTYMKSKFFWANLKGLQNRKRIWRNIEEVFKRIQSYREQGRVGR